MTEPGGDNQLVTINDITAAPVELPVAEVIVRNQNPLTGRDERLGQHLGWIGKFIGGGPEKAGNIASIVVLAALILLIGAAAGSAYAVDGSKIAPVFDKIVAGCFALITGALGYLFGSSKDGK